MFTLADMNSILFMYVLNMAKIYWFYKPRDEWLLSVYVVNCVVVIYFDINGDKR